MSVTKNQQTKTWTVQIWYKDFTGKRKHTTKRGFPTKREAEKWEREFLCSTQPEKITVGELKTRFFKDIDLKVSSGMLRDTSAYHKKNAIKLYIIPYFKDTLATDITVHNVNEWLNELANKHSSLRNTRLSSGTIKNAKQILSQMFEYGIKNCGLTTNPVQHSNNVAFYSSDDRKMWTKEQFIVFHKAMDRYPQVKLIFDIIFGSGLRLGEVLALTPADILPYYISVEKGIVRLRYKGTLVHPPKTKSSVRKVEIPRSLYFSIKEYIDTIKDIKPTDRIFSITDSHIRYCLDVMEQKLGLPHTSPHKLRHLYASMVYSETKDLAIIASQLGHKNMDITAKVYAHMIEGNDRLAVDKLENILSIK